jgi:hypothetical protein
MIPFRMQAVTENSAKITLDHASLTVRLHELEYLVLNLTTLANQLAEADVLTYVQSAAVATTFVSSKESEFLCVQIDFLFEEINKYVFP